MTPPPAPTLIASRYRVLRELGRGGMGVVYLVEHTNTGEPFALKVLLTRDGVATPEMLARFKNEARAPAKIKSEHVVKVVDADVAPELDGAPFMVMELLQGEDVEKRLARVGQFAPQEVIHVLAQVASALDRAHAIGITHRDLKPENIFLHQTSHGEMVKILDFGISKLAGESANDISNAGLTKTGAMMGTPLYMSPEQARGRVADIGPASDIWSLGLIAYRLLTGKIYWQANTLAELLVQIISEPMEPPSQRGVGGPAFDSWFARSTERNPRARFGTVVEQTLALAQALGLPAPAIDSAPKSAHTPRIALPATLPMPPSGIAFKGGQTTNAPLSHVDGQSLPQTLATPRAPWKLAAWIGGALVVVSLAVGGYRLFSDTSGVRESKERVSAESDEETPKTKKKQPVEDKPEPIASAASVSPLPLPTSNPSTSPSTSPLTSTAAKLVATKPATSAKIAPVASGAVVKPIGSPEPVGRPPVAESTGKAPKYEPTAP